MYKLLIFLSLAAFITCWTDFPVPNTATANQLVDLHNAERKAVGLGNLSWSSTLATAAQKWANYLGKTNQFYHSGAGGVGENIAQATFRSNMVAFMFSQWSSEKKYFNPLAKWGDSAISTDPSQEVGHYTQIIWSMTYQVGCGIANTTTMSILVCQYIYPGNYIGNYAYIPSATNKWMAKQPIPNPATLPKPPTPNTYPTVLDSATVKTLLDLHNAERTFVGMPTVTWSSTLAVSAQAHANKQAKAGTFYLSGTPGVGENMQLATIQPNTVAGMFGAWASEKIYFDATLPYPKCAIGNKMISHYTQVVWSATKTIGCGVATNSVNSILVCQYSLGGNYIGNYVVYPPPAKNFDFTL